MSELLPWKRQELSSRKTFRTLIDKKVYVQAVIATRSRVEWRICRFLLAGNNNWRISEWTHAVRVKACVWSEGYSCDPGRCWFARAEGRGPWRFRDRARPPQNTDLLQERRCCSSAGARTGHTAWRGLRHEPNLIRHHQTSPRPSNTPLRLYNTDLWSFLDGFSAPCTWWRFWRASRRRRRDSGGCSPESAVAPQQLQHAVEHRGTSEEHHPAIYCTVAKSSVFICNTNIHWPAEFKQILKRNKINIRRLSLCSLLWIIKGIIFLKYYLYFINFIIFKYSKAKKCFRDQNKRMSLWALFIYFPISMCVFFYYYYPSGCKWNMKKIIIILQKKVILNWFLLNLFCFLWLNLTVCRRLKLK